jgi:hypothetical protein
MSRYRKKPVEVEARQFDGSEACGNALVAWLTECGAQAEYHPFLADRFKGDPKVYVAHPDPYMRVVTLEGTMVASKGDFIIRGVHGEFYPCKPDIFAATYEPVSGDTTGGDE